MYRITSKDKMTTTLSFSPGSPILMVDLSYYIFHRFFATQRWYGFQNKEAEANKLTGDEAFMTAYKKHFCQDMLKFAKKLASKTTNPVVLLKDCMRSNIWRNEYHSGYKEGRTVSDKMDTGIFQKTYEWLASKPFDHYLISVDRLEADDLAYLMKNKIRNVPQSSTAPTPIIIITNDNDYAQLCDENCKIYNAGLKNIMERFSGYIATDIKTKILLGDKSDNITPCLSTKHKKLMQTLCEMEANELEEWLKAEGLYDKYLQNRMLVDMSYIPQNLQEEFHEVFTIKMA